MPKGLCRVNAIVPIQDSVPFFCNCFSYRNSKYGYLLPGMISDIVRIPTKVN